MINTIEKFLEDEISYQDMYEEICAFITSTHIRNGEFEGNYYILKKMDLLNFIIYPEDLYPDNHREISYCISIYKHDLLKKITDYAKQQGLNIIY